MKKIFVLDTNVLIHDPEAINNFEENDVIIPVQVIMELDKLKKGSGEIPYSARYALRLIDSLRKVGNILQGIPLSGGGSLKTRLNSEKNHLPENTPDNRIISVAVNERNNHASDADIEVVLVSKDTSVRILAESLGLVAQDYEKDKTTVFQKYGHLLNEDDYNNGIFSVRYQISGDKILQLRGTDESRPIRRLRPLFGLEAKNRGQECAMDALTDPSIQIVALTGRAGSGKTLLSLAAGLHQATKTDKLFQQVIVGRPVIPMGGRENDLGFLPGDIKEKLDPWMQPIYDNLDVIIKQSEEQEGDKADAAKYKNVDYLIDNGHLQIESLAHIRGRSLPKKYIIIDEAQNLRPLDIKTIVTRCGEGTKLILTGDLTQIDTPYLDAESNGLAHLISKYINEPEFCYMYLQESARSSMAEKAAMIL